MKLLLWILLLLAIPLCQANPINKPQLQLANIYQQPDNIQDYYVSEKLDGIRGFWNGKALISRGGHIINSPPFFTKDWPMTPMDGELWLTRGQFEQTASAVLKQQPIEQEWALITFMIFDLPEHTGRFDERVTAMQTLVETTQSPTLAMVAQHKVKDHSALMSFFNNVVNNKGEGVMLHHKDALYNVGRTDQLMKLKPYFDAEAVVIKHKAGKGKYRSMLGAIEVKTNEGVTFSIGTGFTDEQRKYPPPIGSIITFKYSGKTASGVPRFASFLRVKTQLKDN